MAALSTAAATVFPVGCRFSVRYSCRAWCGDKIPYTTAVGLNSPNNDFDIVHACCYITILSGSLHKLDVLVCLCRSIELASRLLADLSVRLVIHPSSLRPPVYSVYLKVAVSFDMWMTWRSVYLVQNDNYKLYAFTKTHTSVEHRSIWYHCSHFRR
jgi:hypothetical protein